MRRIYKPDNITTSETDFLLKDIADCASFSDDSGALSDFFEDDFIEADAQNDSAENDTGMPRAKCSAKSAVRQNSSEHFGLEQLRSEIIAQATAEAARLIEEGHAKAQAEYNDAIARAQRQIEADRQAAIEDGRQQAFSQTSQDIINCVRDIEQTLTRLESLQASFITGYEQDLKWMALEIAQKILLDTIEADETRLVPLVLAAVNSAGNAPWMTVEISEHMAGLLTQLQQRIKEFSPGRVSLRLVDTPADTCIVETPDTFFDASITQQIENLKGYFAAEQG